MISQVIGFSVLFILVFGGIIGTIIRFTLFGNVHANVSNRIPEKRIHEALEQTGKLEQTCTKRNAKSRKISGQSAQRNVCKIGHEFSKLQPPV